MWILVWLFQSRSDWRGFGAGLIPAASPRWDGPWHCLLPVGCIAVIAMHWNLPEKGGEHPSFTINTFHWDKHCLTDAWQWTAWLGNSFFSLLYLRGARRPPASPLPPTTTPDLPCPICFFCTFGQHVTCLKPSLPKLIHHSKVNPSRVSAKHHGQDAAESLRDRGGHQWTSWCLDISLASPDLDKPHLLIFLIKQTAFLLSFSTCSPRRSVSYQGSYKMI